jgi:DNA polymerase I-like protein with 3'-5' exonuclease and polymerase domains
MKSANCVRLDFETLPIENRNTGRYPPEPVGFSLRMPGQRAPKYYAWGHRTGGNNCTREDAARVLAAAYQEVTAARPLMSYNGKFDWDVAEAHFGLPIPPWHCVHDPMFLLFLDDPHQRELGLKPSAVRLLGMDKEEQDTVKDWVLSHKEQLEAEFPEIKLVGREWKDGEWKSGGIKPSNAGAFVAYVPGTVAGPYANGDITRMEKLHDLLYHRVVHARGMGAAYDRERQLLPILLRNEREGVRVDTDAMAVDQKALEASQAKCDAWLRKALKAPALDLDKDAEVAKALDAADMITEWTMTPTGRKSTSKKNMKLSHFRDRKVAAAYSYRQKAATTLETFIRPWQRFGASGTMRTQWNQVRQPKGGSGDTGGTRTGRPSTQDPNFLNMPKAVKDDEQKGFIMPTHIRDLAPIPRVRNYVLPDSPKHLIGRRDFNQQELRILAHFEDGALMENYQRDPKLDVHSFVKQAVLDLAGLDIVRDVIKTIVFGFIYGQGADSLAQKLELEAEKVKQIRQAILGALPGLKDLDKNLKWIGKSGQFLTTWGGRQYYAEPPLDRGGWFQTFEYKLLNYLIQGSAADVTKESIIRYDAARKDGRFMLSVYDENNISVPAKAAKKEMLLLRECMMSIELDVPLLSEGEMGPRLGSLEKLAEPAPNLGRWKQAA